MRTIFLAYSYRNDDLDLAAGVERLLASHDIRAVTGERLGGRELTSAIKERIRKADGLVALLTRREELAGGGWTTHDWVKSELNFARDNQKPAVGLVETGVTVGGPYGENERITLVREQPLAAMLALSAEVGQWKRESGRTLKVRIHPAKVARQVADTRDPRAITCRYRFWEEGGTAHEWRDGVVVSEVGGVFLYLRGARDEYLIEVEVEVEIDGQGAKWRSHVTSQHLSVTMRSRGA